MNRCLPALVVLLCTQTLASGADPEIVLEDPLRGKLGAGWEWLREYAKAWRNTEKGLEIMVQPGLADSVKNALARTAPDRSAGKFAIDVTVEFTSPPSNQYEQGGITWYQGNKPVFKLVHEFIDGKTYVIPGNKPTSIPVVQLRLIVNQGEYVAQYRPAAEGEFLTAAAGKLPAGKDEKVSIQCYNGPANAEHWVRFSDFQITKLEK